MSFSESLNQCLKRSIPSIFLGLTFLATYLAKKSHGGTTTAPHWLSNIKGNATAALGDYSKNDLLIGSSDPHFWFLVPAFGVMSVGLCVAVNYAALIITYFLTAMYAMLHAPAPRLEDGK
jgi:glycosylphosphatidylinositol deacylase